ncbi:hypothetical protein DPX16_17224 [Anabarilius grahami]|uniref:Uncharacterized protein n=1 Tax=Anabarilius grahami TaxID=495550 RepID=A0A3N0YAY9_ANAGA|nr:hypothetical protein DPX16_17224 [Anabarilius grahami]
MTVALKREKSSNKKKLRNEETLRKIPKLTTLFKKNSEEPTEVDTADRSKDNETNALSDSATTSAVELCESVETSAASATDRPNIGRCLPPPSARTSESGDDDDATDTGHQFSPIKEHITSTDVACWGLAVTEELRSYWVSKGVKASLLCQNKDVPCIRAILQKPEEVFKQNLVYSLYA